MERKNFTTEEVMEKLDLFEPRFGKVNDFGWWYMERIQTDSVTEFTSNEFQEGLYLHRLHQ